VVHAPGKLHESPWWEPVKTAVFASTATYTSPPSLAIVTWNSGAPDAILSVRGHTLGWFERSVAHVGLEATVLGGDIGSAWTNRHKLDLTIDLLSHTTHRYVLGADSSDALLVGDPHAMLEQYLRLDVPMLFNAEKNFWPPELRSLREFEGRDRARAVPLPELGRVARPSGGMPRCISRRQTLGRTLGGAADLGSDLLEARLPRAPPDDRRRRPLHRIPEPEPGPAGDPGAGQVALVPDRLGPRPIPPAIASATRRWSCQFEEQFREGRGAPLP